MGVLNIMLVWIVEGGLVNGLKMDRGFIDEMDISHLLFVDDTILFCDAFAEKLLYICFHSYVLLE